MQFAAWNPEAAASLKDFLAEDAPFLYKTIMETTFGDMYTREGLDPKVRQAATLAALASSHREKELTLHVGVARSLGFSKAELIEVFTQIFPFAGFAASMIGIAVVQNVLADDDTASE